MKGKNRLRGYVAIIMCCNRLYEVRREAEMNYIIENLTFFNDNWENVEKSLKAWMFSSIRVSYLSVNKI